MAELVEMVLNALALLIPKRVREWIMKQNKVIRTILHVICYLLAICVAVLFFFLLFCIFLLIANGLFGCDYSIKDFGPSWIFAELFKCK